MYGLSSGDAFLSNPSVSYKLEAIADAGGRAEGEHREPGSGRRGIRFPKRVASYL